MISDPRFSVPPKEPTAGETHIVVVDDDELHLKIVSKLLVAAGYQVSTFPSCERALATIKNENVHLAILDVVMPGLSGLEGCSLIKRFEGFIPVILMSARGETRERVAGLERGADDFLSKPIQNEELLARVRAMLRIKYMHDMMAETRKRLEQISTTDELTGVYNRRYLQRRLREELKRAIRYREPLAVAMLDIDKFKSINDTHGHDVGDIVIATLAQRLQKQVRETDVVARYAGDEFFLILPNTHFSGALTVAERVWHAVRGTPAATRIGPVKMTISMGVALYPQAAVSDHEDLMRHADEALYKCKENGRDQICVAQGETYLVHPSENPR